MNLNIENENIEKSFDRIATEILNKKTLFVNEKSFRITEIEFYYFHEDFHKDNYTHEHKRDFGEWRFHNQGLDITFQSNEKSDGGILIRGIQVNNEYVNGPRKIIRKIFEHFGKVSKENKILLSNSTKRNLKILKTFRHLPNKHQEPEFKNKQYRYLTDLENLDMPNSIKEIIKGNSTYL